MTSKSLLLASALLFAGLLNPLAPMLAQDAAATGTSTTGHELRDFGNPCNAWGVPGGIAANAAARQVFYGGRNNTTIFRLTHNAAFTTLTCSWFTWAAGQGNGWSSLAFGNGVLWGTRNGTAEVWRIPLPTCAQGATCAYTPVKWLTAPGADARGLAIPGTDIVTAPLGGSTFYRYANAATGTVPPVAPTPAAIAPLGFAPDGIRGLANFGGALFVLDQGHDVRTYAPSGLGSMGRFWVHDQVHSNFHQHEDQGLWDPLFELAFDATAFAPKGAVWVTQEEFRVESRCLSGCLPPPCLRYETTESGTQYCVQFGTDPDGPAQVESVSFPYPTVEAHEAPRAPCTGPEFTCQCAAPEPVVVATGPQATYHVRGTPVSPPSPTPYPVFYRGPATLTAAIQGNAPDPLLWMVLDGQPLYSAVPASSIAHTILPTDPLWQQRGLHTWHVYGFDRAQACFIGGPLERFWVEDPVLRSHAQALRVEGNLPAHLVAQTPVMAPADDLAGAESGLVLDRTNPAPLAVDAELLGAHAEHGLLQGPDRFIARASASIERVAVGLDLAGLCALATGNDPACAPLPSVQRSLEGMRDSVLVEAWPLANQWDTLRDFQLHNSPAVATTCQDLQGLPGFSWRSGPGCQVAVNQHLTVEYNIETIRSGPTWAERTFVPLRIVVDNGALLGEVVVGEVYAGISLSGAARLLGPPGTMPGEGDYQFPGDAPASGGPLLGPGAHHGFFEGADIADSFRFTASQGDEVRLVISPGHRAQVTLEPLPTPPAALAQLRELRVTVYDSAGAAVAAAATTPANLPQVFATVAPATGDFRVVVERLDPGELRATYGVALQVNAPVV